MDWDKGRKVERKLTQPPMRKVTMKNSREKMS